MRGDFPKIFWYLYSSFAIGVLVAYASMLMGGWGGAVLGGVLGAAFGWQAMTIAMRMSK